MFLLERQWRGLIFNRIFIGLIGGCLKVKDLVLL